MLMRTLRDLAEKQVDFGKESTLSARAYIPLIQKWRNLGHTFHLFYIWLPSADMAVERVAARVRAGGHNIPEATIRRRYEAGRLNFSHIYRPYADRWTVLDNSTSRYRVVAKGEGAIQEVFIKDVWEQIHARTQL